MSKLTEFVILLANEADSVPEWLSTHSDYKPLQLLSDFSVMAVDKAHSDEESKEDDASKNADLYQKNRSDETLPCFLVGKLQEE